jgi:glutaminyl-peptide cyclotransferase
METHLKESVYWSKMKLTVSILILFLASSCGAIKTESEVNAIPFSVVKIFPHDTSAFTQGLVIEYGRLFESTGQEGSSWIAEVELATGKQDKKVVLAKPYFGEGITILNKKIYQLTWKSKKGFVYDIDTFEKVNEFEYGYEGWGITHNGKNLIVSDGTDKLHFLDTATLKQVSELRVTQNLSQIDQLNELEFIDGYLFANRWMTNEVVKIDLSNGYVVGRLNLAELAREANQKNPNADVLNGIAYEKKSGLLLVTGKWWPFLFALRLDKVEESK